MSWQAERARVASLSRSRPPDDPDLMQARRNLRAKRTAEYLKRVVDELPPLTDEQREHLAALLAPGRSA